MLIYTQLIHNLHTTSKNGGFHCFWFLRFWVLYAQKGMKAMINIYASDKKNLVARLLNNASQEVIDLIYKLPELNQDVLLLSYGLDGKEPMDDKEIANFINREYDGADIKVDKVPFIREDAISMLGLVDEEVEEFKLPKLDFEFGSSKLISWDDLAEIANTVQSMEEMQEFLESKYDKNSVVFLPSLSELYESERYNDYDSFKHLKIIASIVCFSLKTNGYKIKANICTGDVNLAAVLDFTYLNFSSAKEIVIDSRRDTLQPC